MDFKFLTLLQFYGLLLSMRKTIPSLDYYLILRYIYTAERKKSLFMQMECAVTVCFLLEVVTIIAVRACSLQDSLWGANHSLACDDYRETGEPN